MITGLGVAVGGGVAVGADVVGAEGVGAGAVGEAAATVVVGAGVVVATAVGAGVGVLVDAGLAVAVAGADVGTAVVGAEVVGVEEAVAMETGADGKTGPCAQVVTRNNTTKGSTRNAGATIRHFPSRRGRLGQTVSDKVGPN